MKKSFALKVNFSFTPGFSRVTIWRGVLETVLNGFGLIGGSRTPS
jgi:hypothetical protein